MSNGYTDEKSRRPELDSGSQGPSLLRSRIKCGMTKIGFTLAEVLITLGIIGVVAAMTIPTLMNKTQDKETVTALKKAYSMLSQAYILAEQENGTPDSWNLIDIYDPQGAENILKILSPYLKITKNCGRTAGCFPTEKYKFLNGSDYTSYDSTDTFAKVQLGDGSLLLVYVTNPTCNGVYGTTDALSNMCGYAVIDTNGLKKPNQCGADTFHFYLTKSGFIPAGTANDTMYKFSDKCRDKTMASSGIGCAAWVIYNENTDYKRCTTLSWTGPTKCQ